MLAVARRAPPVRGKGTAHLRSRYHLGCMNSPFRSGYADARQRKGASMAVRDLPPDPSLEHLKNQARDLQRRIRAGDPGAVAAVREFHPRLGAITTESSELARFSLA